MFKLACIILLASSPIILAWQPWAAAVLRATLSRARRDAKMRVDAMAPSEAPWYREAGEGLRFGCTECGRCCKIEVLHI
jgi:hypothetical protein